MMLNLACSKDVVEEIDVGSWVTIDFDHTVEQLLRESNYSTGNKDLTSTNCLPIRFGSVELRPKLIKFDRCLDKKLAYNLIQANDREAADARLGLTLVRLRPQYFYEKRVICLGKKPTNRYSEGGTIIIDSVKYNRWANHCCWTGVWDATYYYLAFQTKD